MASPETETDGELPVVAPPASARCRHLRNNGGYVFTDGSPQEDYDSSMYWCERSLKGFGPDDDLVGGRECRDPARSCYEPL